MSGSLASGVRAGVRRLFRLALRRPGRVAAEIDDEIRFHLELRTEQLVRGGMPPDLARAEAVRRFGALGDARRRLHDSGLRKESRMQLREGMEALRQDLRYAARGLGARPGFAAAVVLMLALAIGANSAVFTVVNATWFRWQGAFERPERLVMVFKTWGTDWGPTSPADFRDWRERARSFDGLAGYFHGGLNLAGDGEPARLTGAFVSANMFRLLGVRPLAGRAFLPSEEAWGSHRVALLGHGLWVRRFGADPGVVGRTLILNGDPYRVVGVLPAGAWFADVPAEIFLPLALAPNDPINDRHSHFVWAVGRLRPGVTLAQANADVRDAARRVAELNPENQGTSARATPLRDVILGDIAPTLRLLAGAVALVLLIACANVANLLLVRGAARERELAVRTALGATRARLARLLLAESVTLAALGGALGLALALAALPLAARALPVELPRVYETGLAMDWRVLALTAGVALLTGLACGTLPALHAPGAGGALGRALREGGRGTAGGSRGRRVREGLVVAEVALALMLLAGAGLLVRSFVRLERVDTGVRPDNVLAARLSPARGRGTEPRERTAFFAQVLERVAGVRGVRTAGVTSHLPLGGGGESKAFWVEGRAPAASLSAVPSVWGRQESPGSLPAMGVSLVRGRWFTDADHADAPGVAIVSEEIVRRFFPGEDPIGRRISLHPPEHLWPVADLPPGGKWPRWTIVGVVRDVKYQGLRGRAEPLVYVPYRQGLLHWNWGPEFLVVRTSARPLALTDAVRRAVWGVDPTIPLADLTTLRERMAVVLREPRFTLWLMAAFAAVALLLGAVGLYGVIAYAVSQETRAIAIRLALGATPAGVLRAVLRRWAMLTLGGVATGLAGAALLSRALASKLYGVSGTDPATYALTAAVLAAVAALASIIPARRATSVDPVEVLRGE